jgi:hypothetical protein
MWEYVSTKYRVHACILHASLLHHEFLPCKLSHYQHSRDNLPASHNGTRRQVSSCPPPGATALEIEEPTKPISLQSVSRKQQANPIAARTHLHHPQPPITNWTASIRPNLRSTAKGDGTNWSKTRTSGSQIIFGYFSFFLKNWGQNPLVTLKCNQNKVIYRSMNPTGRFK